MLKMKKEMSELAKYRPHQSSMSHSVYKFSAISSSEPQMKSLMTINQENWPVQFLQTSSLSPDKSSRQAVTALSQIQIPSRTLRSTSKPFHSKSLCSIARPACHQWKNASRRALRHSSFLNQTRTSQPRPSESTRKRSKDCKRPNSSREALTRACSKVRNFAAAHATAMVSEARISFTTIASNLHHSTCRQTKEAGVRRSNQKLHKSWSQTKIRHRLRRAKCPHTSSLRSPKPQKQLDPQQKKRNSCLSTCRHKRGRRVGNEGVCPATTKVV